MDIKLLSNVLHDNVLLPSGTVCHEVPEADALRLIASGSAVAVEEILDAPSAPSVVFPGQATDEQVSTTPGSLGAESEPAALASPFGGAADVAANTEPSPAAADSKAAESETGKKAAKGEGK